MTKSHTNNLTSRRRKLALTATLTLGSLGVISGVGGGTASAIVDGNDTTISANPWQVALTDTDGSQFCGGSIISDRIILTAAHCTLGMAEGEIQILAGVTDLSAGGGQVRNVTAVIEHPKYVDEVGDIAMIVLDQPLDLGANVAAIALATPADITNADTARVTGWGTTSETSEDSPVVLQSTDVPLVSDADCQLVDEGNDDELCAGGTGTDSCYGDSGGPLTIATENGHVLAGVVSWGEECGGETAGVYAEVPTYTDWVGERVADPDAPAGERLPSQGGDFDDGDFFDDDGFDDDGGFEMEDGFFDDYTDEALDAMTDDEFFEAYDEWLDANQDTGDSDTDVSDTDAEPAGDLPTNDAIDAMSDDEFYDFIDGLTDADFDAFLDQYDADTESDEIADEWNDEDWNDWNDDDQWSDDSNWDDSNWEN